MFGTLSTIGSSAYKTQAQTPQIFGGATFQEQISTTSYSYLETSKTINFPASSEFTIEGIFYRYFTNVRQTIFSLSGTDNTITCFLDSSSNSDCINLTLTRPTVGDVTINNASILLRYSSYTNPVGSMGFFHVVITRQSDNKIRIFINGALHAISGIINDTLSFNNIFIGKHPTSDSYYMASGSGFSGFRISNLNRYIVNTSTPSTNNILFSFNLNNWTQDDNTLIAFNFPFNNPSFFYSSIDGQNAFSLIGKATPSINILTYSIQVGYSQNKGLYIVGEIPIFLHF